MSYSLDTPSIQSLKSEAKALRESPHECRLPCAKVSGEQQHISRNEATCQIARHSRCFRF